MPLRKKNLNKNSFSFDIGWEMGGDPEALGAVSQIVANTPFIVLFSHFLSKFRPFIAPTSTHTHIHTPPHNFEQRSPPLFKTK